MSRLLTATPDPEPRPEPAHHTAHATPSKAPSEAPNEPLNEAPGEALSEAGDLELMLAEPRMPRMMRAGSAGLRVRRGGRDLRVRDAFHGRSTGWWGDDR